MKLSTSYIYNTYVNMYAQQSTSGTETERITECLQPQALKRFSVWLIQPFSLWSLLWSRLEQFLWSLLFPSWQSNLEALRVVLAQSVRLSILLLIYSFSRLDSKCSRMAWCLHPVPSLTHLLKQQHLGRMFLQGTDRRLRSDDWFSPSVPAEAKCFTCLENAFRRPHAALQKA